MVFCKQTKLRYSKLTEEEKQWLTRIVQKSELAKSYVRNGEKENNKYALGGKCEQGIIYVIQINEVLKNEKDNKTALPRIV